MYGLLVDAMRFFSQKKTRERNKTLFTALLFKTRLFVVFTTFSRKYLINAINFLGFITKKKVAYITFVFFLISVVYVSGQSASPREFTIETLNVFPDSISSDGWVNIETLYDQNLSEDALYQEFNNSNSAYIDLNINQDKSKTAESTPEEVVGISDIIYSTSTTEVKIPISNQEDSFGKEISDSDVVEEYTKVIDLEGTIQDVQPEDVGLPQQEPTESVPDEVIKNTEEVIQDVQPEDVGLPQQEPTESVPDEVIKNTEEVVGFKKLEKVVGLVFKSVFGLFPLASEDITVESSSGGVDNVENTEAYADTDNNLSETLVEEIIIEDNLLLNKDSNPVILEDDTVNDINLIEENEYEPSGTTTIVEDLYNEEDILEAVDISSEQSKYTDKTECVEDCKSYTITLSGFGVPIFNGSDDINGAQMRFSFASKFGKNHTDINDSFVVRYSIDGGENWDDGANLLFNDESSNSINGGYYLSALPVIDDYDALNSLVVQFEYTGDPSSLDGLFIDSAWLELFVVRQLTPEENLAFALQEDDGYDSKIPSGDILELSDGNEIRFTNTDENKGETLIIKSNTETYEGLTETSMFFNVTNTSNTTDKFSIKMYFPEGVGEVTSLEEWNPNKPHDRVVPEYKPYLYQCAAGWESVKDYTSESLESVSKILVQETKATKEIIKTDNVKDTLLFEDNLEVSSSTENVIPDKDSVLELSEDVPPLVAIDKNTLSEDLGTLPVDVNLLQDEAYTDNEYTDDSLLNQYVCRDTSVVRGCDSIDGDNTSCMVEDVKVREYVFTTYGGGWEKRNTNDGELKIKRSLFKKAKDFFGFGLKTKDVPESFEVREHSADTYDIKPGETKYFKMKINFPPLSNGEFYIEAVGENKLYGLLDPYWSSEWKYRVPITIDNNTGTQDLTEQQVLLNLTSTGLSDFWLNVNSDGSDVRFVAETVGNENDTWYDTSWNKRLPLDIQFSQVNATLTNFPVYVDLSTLGASFFADVQSSGADIRITTSDGVTEVPYELVSIDTATKIGELYFKAPTISNSANTKFYIYYNNPGSLGYGTTDTYGSQNVWTNGYAGVWHMNDVGATIIDSTSNGYTGTKGGGTSNSTEITGTLGNAQSFDGGDYIDLGDMLNPGTSNWTVDVLYRPTAIGSTNNGILYNKETLYEAAAGGNVHTFAWQPNWAWVGGSTFATAVGNWYQATVVYDKITQEMFRNGTSVFNASQTGNIGSNTSKLLFGARGDTNPYSFFTGDIDEIRMSNVARSASWLSSQYKNLATSTDFYATSSVETLTTTTYIELDFWLQYFNTTTSEADIWVQVDSLAAATTTTIYMYYGNNSAITASDELETFTYSTTTDTYYVVQSFVTSPITVYSLIDNNIIQVDGGTEILLNKGETTSITTYASTSVISVLGPVSLTIDGAGSDTILPISFASTTFASPTNRGISQYAIFSPFGNASLQTYIAASTTPDENVTVATGTAYLSNTDSGNNQAVIIESTEPVLSYHRDGGNDAYVLYPPTTENIFGIDSNNTQITTLTSNPDPVVRCSGGVTATVTGITRGEEQGVDNCTQGSEGTGDAVMFTGALYPITAIQQADSDGNESTIFLPQKEFSTEFYIPTSAAYVAVVCSPRFGTSTIEVRTNSGTVVESATCTPSGNLPGKAYFANGGNGDTLAFSAGHKIVSTNGVPFYIIYEDQVDGDETNLWGAVQARKFLRYPVATSFGVQELTIDAQYDQRSFWWYQNIDTQTPTSTWPLGEGVYTTEGDPVVGQGAVNDQDVLRLRMNLLATVATGTASTSAFKLQYTASDTCSATSNSWYDVGAIGSTTSAFTGYDNSSVSDGSAVASTTLASSTVFATYEEENLSSRNPNTVNPGDFAEWDWVIQSKNATVNTNFCFRMVRSSNQELVTYTNYPELYTAGPPLSPNLLVYFDNERTADMSPILEFVATDSAGDEINYQVQIDNNFNFSSPEIDINSLSSYLDFENLNTPSDKAPFDSNSRIRFTSPTALTASTTYWWRVRGRDPNGSNTDGEWSSLRSFTIDGSVLVSEWFQTTGNQFDTDTLSGLSTSTGAVALVTSPATLATAAVDFDDATVGNAWGEISWNDTETSGSIVYQVEYLNGSSWSLVPDSEILGNGVGISTSPINILGLDTNTYNQLRIVATLTGTTLSIQDITLIWGQRVNIPTLGDPFDNEKTSDLTPTFTFTTTDPQGDSLEYEISYGTDYTFVSSTTVNSSTTPVDFANVSTPADTNPYNSGDNISYTVPVGSALTDNTTYWWKVRAKDPSGANSWSPWSDPDSFTASSTTIVSTWLQTTKEQFEQGTFNGLKASISNSVVVNDVIGEYGRATTTDNTWLKITTQNTYSNMVVTGSARYTGNPQPERTVRVRNKTSNSFEIKVDDYTGAFVGGNTVVDYMIVEAGDWTILDGGTGTRIVAGTLSDVSTVKARTYATTGSIPVSFVPVFSVPPVVIATVSTDNDTTWVFTHTDDAVNRANEPTTSQAGFALARGFESAVHDPEDIDYIAMDVASGTNNGVKYDFLRTPDNVDSTAIAMNYSNTTFTNPPGVIVLNNIGEDGGDGGFAFIETATPGTATQFYPEIGEGGVGANGHTQEIISAVAFENESGTLLRDNTTVSLSGTIAGEEILFSDGLGPKFERALFTETSLGNSTTSIQVQYLTSTSSWALIPDSTIPGNSVGTTTSPIDLTSVDTGVYTSIRLYGTLTCDGANCPELHDWAVEWSEGVSMFGTAKAYDRTTNVTSGTVRFAVNGVLGINTGTIAVDGTWSINNVTAFDGDVVTVWVDGANDPNEAVNVFVYDGIGDMTGVELYEQHLTVSSDEKATTTNALLAAYDNSVSGDEDIFFDVTPANDLEVCDSALTGCGIANLYIGTGNVYVPATSTAENIITHDLINDGTIQFDANTIKVSGSWTNNATLLTDTSTVVFTATSTTEWLTDTSNLLSFYKLTFGETSGNATWKTNSSYDINSDLAVSYGTFDRASSSVTVAGGVNTGAGGFWLGIASTTFDGSGTQLWSDANSTLQNIGNVTVDGSVLTVNMTSDVRAQSLVIALGNTLNAGGANGLYLSGDFTNNNVFTAQTGSVIIDGLATNAVVNAGASSLYNFIASTTNNGSVSFNQSSVTVLGDFTIATGTVTMPTVSLSVGGSFANIGGTFAHNNAKVIFTGSGVNTIQQNGTAFFNAFYDITFTGSGAWGFNDTNATTSNDFDIQSGTVTFPSGQLTVGGLFSTVGTGTFVHNGGEVVLLIKDGNTILTNGSSFNNIRVKTGAGSGVWYDNNWGYRKAVNISASAIDETLSDYPVYIDLSDFDATFFTNVQADGSDIRITTSDGTTEIPYELTAIGTTLQTGEMYLKAPNISSTTNTTFYVYYGNTEATAYLTTDTYGAQNVWTNGYAGVWHMNDVGSTVTDSTANGYTGTKGGGTAATTEVTSPIGKAQSFDGNDYIDFGDVLNPGTNAWTVDVWYMPTVVGSSQAGILYNKETLYEGSAGGNDSQYAWQPSWAWYGAGAFVTSINNWYLHTVTFDHSNQRLYKDGAQVFSRVQTGNIGSNTSKLLIGARGNTSPSSFFTGEIDEVRMSSVARSAAWLNSTSINVATTSDFYSVSTAESSFVRTFSDTNTTVLGNIVVESGEAVFPTGILSVGGSFDNNGIFNANGGTVKFDSSVGSKTIASGVSNFSTLIFDGASGDFTIIENATATNAINLTNASAFTLNSGLTLESTGIFKNTVGGASTTWNGSTLRLSSGTDYSLNTKYDTGDIYSTLLTIGDTNISMWNSTSSVYTTLASSSIYSQDHNGVNGDLYIFGDYSRESGTEYWSYATDFDGTDLSGGSERQVNVRASSGSFITASSSTLEIIGSINASTTINSQSGTFSLTSRKATVTAQYFETTGTDVDGFNLTGSSTVTLFDNALFTIGAGTSAVTVDASTIDIKPAAQFFNTNFVTVGGSVNVTLSGSPTSYWWFRDGVGNRYGEAFDNADGDPGSIRWDDSSYGIVLSGVIYVDDGITPLGGPTCDGITNNVRVVVDGGTFASSTSCSGVDGSYSFTNVSYIGDPDIIVYLDTNGGEVGSTVTKTPTADITNFNIYTNRVIVRHEDIQALTISDMVQYDEDDDSDIRFVAATGTPNTLIVRSDTELVVASSTTFVPDGNVTLQSGGSGQTYDGSLHIDDNAVFTATSTEVHSVGGSLFTDVGSTFNSASSTFIFTATTSGKTITGSSPITFNGIDFTGVGGGWNLNVDITVLENIEVATGTLTGTGSVIIPSGTFFGEGLVSFGGGTTTIETSSILGGSASWVFNNLKFGNGSVNGTTTRAGLATTTVGGALTVSAGHTLKLGGSGWLLSGAGTPIIINGVLDTATSTVLYSASNAQNIVSETYYNLLFEAGSGSPTYTVIGLGVDVLGYLKIGENATTTVNFDTNDSALNIEGDITIGTLGTFIASNSGSFTLAGSYDNNGVFTSSNGTITFDGSAVHTIAGGNSSFGTVIVDGSGDFTVSENATATTAFTITSANNFTLASSQALAVGGIFTNSVGGVDTIWNGSTLYLYGGGNYEINASTTNDSYDKFVVGANTDIRMWNSIATTTSVDNTGSLYSQDHNQVDGDLYIFGNFVELSRNDYWSYATDFDGTDLSGSGERKVNVYIGSGGGAVWTGGSIEVLGTTFATTTVQNQGFGNYSLRVGGVASTSMSYYKIRDIDSNGLTFSGSSIIDTLSYGDLLVDIDTGSGMTVGGTVIDQNPAKTFTNNIFATSSAISAVNVTATGTSVSSWRFTNHTGNISGEAFDSDPGGDPGYVVWDDSSASISISGNVYSDEGSTVSSVCDGSTSNIHLRVAGLTSYTVSCNAGTGAYSISGVSYSPNDTLTLYIDGEVVRAANVTIDPISSIGNMDLYENRVIVRHESTNPISISDMSIWDSSDDVDIPFTALTGTPDTLNIPSDTKIIVWHHKEFAPAGNVTLTGGGGGATYDGTLELYYNSIFTAVNGESHSIGGSLITGSSATFDAAQSTTTFTTSGSARTVDTNEQNFYNLTFNGSGSWNVSNTNLDVSSDFTISAGTVTLPSGTTTISGSMNVSGGAFNNNGGDMVFNSVDSGEAVLAGGSDFNTLTFNGAGSWSMNDTYATTTSTFFIKDGSVTIPSGVLSVGGNFTASSTLVHNNGLVRLVSNSATTTMLLNGSDLYSLTFDGNSQFVMNDTNLALLGNMTINQGTTTLATGTLSIGGSLQNNSYFKHSSGSILFNSADTGETVDVGNSDFYNVVFGSSAGGWTMLASATATNNFSITGASVFVAGSNTIVVDNVFTNTVGGSATNWSNSTLNINSGTEYAINTKSGGGDEYNILEIGVGTDLQMWNSSATTSLASSTSSLYSQDNSAIDGDLYIYGEYSISTSTEYWSYATDFDGAILSGGSRRAVNVYLVGTATSTMTVSDSGTIEIIGVSGATTTIQSDGSVKYPFDVTGGTFNAQYYAFRDLDSGGLTFSNTPTITSLSNGDFEASVDFGSLITLSSTTLNANASKVISLVRFATTTPIESTNVTLTGTTSNEWTFINHTGNISGESFDSDGASDCGSMRWDDSSCLLVQQTNYRWRNDDGGIGVPDNEWFDTNWSKRKQIRVENNDVTTYTNLPVEMVITYDSDMQSDFDDLRFTDNAGTLIPYWVEKYTLATDANIWVQVPTTTSNGVNSIYMYYGNVLATSSATSTGVFNVIDDFEDNNISEYSGDTVDFQTGTTFNNDGTYGLEAPNVNGRSDNGMYRTDITVSQGEIIRYMQYVDTSAGSGDETCTYFGVQGSGSNYAVCLELFGIDRISIMKDALYNDSAAGTVLASTTIIYTTGWHEVEIDWKTDNTINVTVNRSGSQVANATTSDSSYTSGGIGFGYWFQNGGWDSYTSRPRTDSDPTVYFGKESVRGGATFASALNSSANVSIDDIARLRFVIENSGLDINKQKFQIEFAPKASAPSCESVPSVNYSSVPNQAACGSSEICMITSPNVTNLASTTDLLTGISGKYTYGQFVEDGSNNTGDIDVLSGEYIEIEYTITPTVNVSESNYCLRVTEQGTVLDSYTSVAEMVLRFDPTISALSLNGGLDITLTAGTTTTVYATGTVSDLNGYADLNIATSTIFRSGIGENCSSDANDCYISTSPECSFSSCSGNTCDVSCTADIYYYADPTDIGIFGGQTWRALLSVNDQSGAVATATAPSIDLLTLRAIAINNSIDYGTLSVQTDTGGYNATTTIENIGNDYIDISVEGTDLTDSGVSVIPVGEQIFATSTFNYSACTICTTLGSTATNYEVDLNKPTTTSPTVTDQVFWGINVPFGVSGTPHQGNNTFYAIGD